MTSRESLPDKPESTAKTELEKTVLEIVNRSNNKASLQPDDVRQAINNYLEPEVSEDKPWETWL